MYWPALFLLVLVQGAWSYNDDNYPFNDYDTNLIYQDYEDQNPLDPEPTIEKRGNSNFVRFGRTRTNGLRQEPDPRPTRGGKMLRNDYFVRFGRSKQDFLRFGRDHQRYSRSKGDYVRFGRSVETPPSSSPPENRRSKRDARQEKNLRGNSNYLRFGRNSNFLRFGRGNRDHSDLLTQEDLRILDKLRRLYWSLLIDIKDEKECKNNGA